MLENLTKRTFEPYGTIDREGFDHAAQALGYSFIRQRGVTDKQVSRLFVNFHDKTVLDMFNGTAILFVGTSSDRLETFLLDKTVVLNPGVYYYITPMLSTAQISIATTDDTQIVPTDTKNRPEGIVSHIEPNYIYTLFYHEKERGFRFKGEAHDFWELTYVDTGTMYNQVDGRTYRMAQGELMFFAPGQFHSQWADPDVSVCYITLTFSMDFSDRELLSHRVFPGDNKLRQLLSDILKEQRKNQIYSDDLILCYLKQLVIHIIRSRKIENFLKSADTVVRRSVEGNIVAHAKDYIQKHLYDPVSVADIARSIPVSASYLSSTFKKNTGEALSYYISQQKLELAKELIRSGNYTFTQIAQQLGYSSVHYFSSQFKKKFGLTPTQYAGSIG